MVEDRKMRFDTPVVEADIHHTTDSSLLGDGARVLTRTLSIPPSLNLRSELEEAACTVLSPSSVNVGQTHLMLFVEKGGICWISWN